MNLTETIAPRSDQVNADDFMAGPRTVTIVDVVHGSAEQPVNIITAEYGEGRPYKPSKSMRRVMVAAWGPETAVYKGRRLTLFRNPTVRFGKDEVGGIQISHLSHISETMRINLTVAKGRRAPFVVQPLTDQPARISEQQGRDIGDGFTQLDMTDKAERLRYCRSVIGRDITTSADLTADEADQVLASIRKDLDQ